MGIERTKTLHRQTFIKEKTKQLNTTCIDKQLYNQPTEKKAITNHWNFLHINQEFKMCIKNHLS